MGDPEEVTETTDTATNEAPVAAADEARGEGKETTELDAAEIDLLEDQLGRVQGIMDQIQKGDHAGADAALSTLEQEIESARN